MTRVRLTGGPFANFEGEVLAEIGDQVSVAVDIFGRRTEVLIEREYTDMPPLPPVQLPPVATVIDELDRWMTESAPDVRAAHGTTAEDDLHALAALGVGAQDLVELYRRFGGTTDWQGFYHGCELVPLRSAFSTREMMNGLENDGTFYRWMPGEWWNHAWLPFLDNHSYDMYCIDLEGTMGGVPGQVVAWSKDSESRSILAPSLAAWLGAFVIGRDAGQWIWDPHEGIRVHESLIASEHRLLQRALPGYPKPTAARSRKDVEGVEPPPKPPARVEAIAVPYTVTRQFWAPGSSTVHGLAFVEDRELLAVGQYDWGEAKAGLSLVDPHSGDVVEVVLGKDEGSVLELVTTSDAIVLRRLRGSHNEVVVVRDGNVRVVKAELPTRMEAFMALGVDAIAVAGETIEIFDLAEPCALRHRLGLSGTNCVLGLSPDARTLAVAHRDQPLRWFEVPSGRQLGQTEEHVIAHRIEFGLTGDLWVAGNRNAQRFELATGRALDHDQAYSPFVIALHRTTRRIAFAGYGGSVTVLDADTGKAIASDSTHRGRVYGLCWNGAGTRLWSGDEGGQIVERTVG